MNRTQIKSSISEKHQNLFDWVKDHPDNKWIQGPEGKWTTGQHVVHLIQSVKPLNKALSAPKLFLKYKFGISNRNTRSFDEVVNRYKERLASVGQVVSPFSKTMPLPDLSEKDQTLKSLMNQVQKLTKKVNRWNEKDLDKYILPHPLMGRMPIREVLMWTAYHAEHHLNILKEKY